MFTPASKKHHLAASKGRASSLSPSTPVVEGRTPPIPNRPATGTPAPWATRLSVLARIPSNDLPEVGPYAYQSKPVYVGEVPKIVRKTHNDYLQRKAHDDCFCGGMDKSTFLSWIICEDQIFIWNYLTSSLSSECIALDFPTGLGATYYVHSNQLLVYIVKWDGAYLDNNQKKEDSCNSAGVIICHKRTHAVIYWPDVFSEGGRVPITWLPQSKPGNFSSSVDDLDSNHDQGWSGSHQFADGSYVNSIIASPVPGSSLESIALVCKSNDELWCFYCTPSKISLNNISCTVEGCNDGETSSKYSSKAHVRSIAWRFKNFMPGASNRQFFLLTDHEIQCWDTNLAPDSKVKKLWSHEIVGSDGDSCIKKDLAGEKHIWLLDMQVDDSGNEFYILVATICKDRTSASNYIQYSLLNMQYKLQQSAPLEEGYHFQDVLEKKAPIQVIIPKAKMEDEIFLFSLRLRIGGKPFGSAIILSQDGTATVANYQRGTTWLYKFDLPFDGGKVLDASIFPSTDVGEGAWVVLTEKAGIWVIPEKAILLGAVEPPERSLSRKGSSNGVPEEGKKTLEAGAIVATRRSNSEAWITGEREGASFSIRPTHTTHHEEAEVLLGQFYQEFLLSGKADDALEKLGHSGVFEKGEINAFTRLSGSIVDTLAKHWTSTRGGEFVASAVVVSQLLDKQQKHERFLQFLALSKCHEELSSRQKQSLQIIVEHGEKLFGMIKLRELQNILSQNSPSRDGSLSSFSLSDSSGSLWELIQLVGERARRNNVLLMDRDNAEVFYSKVSDIEDLFYCISHHLSGIVGEHTHLSIQIHRAYEISNACVTLVHAAMRYRSDHRTWYPPPEGLIPWNCQPVVRSGLWSIAFIISELLKNASMNHSLVKSSLFSQLESLADILLESYINIITAKDEQGVDYKGLLEEYHERRDFLLDSLYQEAIYFANIKYKDSITGAKDDKLKIGVTREFLQPVLSIAKRHEGYQTLWKICSDLQDSKLLRSLMDESLGPKGGFTAFVFKKFYEMGQLSKILRFGEEYQSELAVFLKHQGHLLWLHEVFLNQFSSASNTLYNLSISCEEDHSHDMVEGDENSQRRPVLTLADRKRLLHLSKISAMAGKRKGFELNIKRIEADIQILKLQEIIMAGQEEKVVDKILPPMDLVRICLECRTREMSLMAFELFAWTSNDVLFSNKILLEECWMNAANQDDWDALHQQSLAEGWSDEVCIQFLQNTVLFQASSRCYGPNGQMLEGRFEDVLPLQSSEGEYRTLKGLGSSVEGILMQHKDFPDAGKLMVTAIVFGKLGINFDEATMEL